MRVAGAACSLRWLTRGLAATVPAVDLAVDEGVTGRDGLESVGHLPDGLGGTEEDGGRRGEGVGNPVEECPGVIAATSRSDIAAEDDLAGLDFRRQRIEQIVISVRTRPRIAALICQPSSVRLRCRATRRGDRPDNSRVT